MLKRTPSLAVIFATIMTLLTIFIFEDPTRPITSGQAILLFCISLFPSLGLAMLLDPNAAEAKRKYLKIYFYDQSKTAEELVAEMEEKEEKEK